MNKEESQLLSDFYTLSHIANDDLELVANIICFHHSPEEKLSRVISDITKWQELSRLEKYAKTIDNILSLPSVYLKVWISVKRERVEV